MELRTWKYKIQICIWLKLIFSFSIIFLWNNFLFFFFLVTKQNIMLNGNSLLSLFLTPVAILENTMIDYKGLYIPPTVETHVYTEMVIRFLRKWKLDLNLTHYEKYFKEHKECTFHYLSTLYFERFPCETK